MNRNWFARLSYLSLFILFALLYRFFANYFLLLLMISMVLFVPFSVIALKYSSSRVSIDMACPARIKKNAAPVDVDIRLRNESMLPVARAAVNLDFRNMFYSQADTHTFIFGIPCGKESTVTVHFLCFMCGAVNLEIENVRMWDYTGMFDTVKTIRAKASFLVMPAALDETMDISAVGGAGLCELVDQDTKGNDSSQIIDTREYIPGDKPNRIHWKLSSKLDKLLVKEYGSISSNDLMVVMELCKPPCESSDPVKVNLSNSHLDACFDIYLTLMNQLMDEKRPFILCYYSPSAGELKSETISSREEGTAALELLFYTGTSSSNPAASMAYTMIDEYGDFIYIRPECPQCAAFAGEKVLLRCENGGEILASAVHIQR